MSVFGRRLKDERKRAGLSQESLGVRAGLDESSARQRLSRYERGDRQPDLDLIVRIAEVLAVPPAYFLAEDDSLAELLLAWGKLKRADRARVIELAGGLANMRSR